MEELLVVILQFFFETLVDAAVFWPFEAASDKLSDSSSATDRRTVFPLVVAVIAGVAVGFISLVVWPHTWLRSLPLRLANLAIAPLISACSAWVIASHRKGTRDYSSPREAAWFATTFTLMFVLMRFIWGAR